MRVVAIASQKGGAGKTTIATHLAVAAAEKGLQVLVLDLDPQANACEWGDHRETLDDDGVEIVVGSDQAVRLKQALDKARRAGADLVVVDTAAKTEQPVVQAAKYSDLLLIVVRPSIHDLRAVRYTVEIAERHAVGETYFLLNGASPWGDKVTDQAREALREYNFPVAPPVLSHRVAFDRSAAYGKTAQEIEPKGRAAEEIHALWEWLAGQLASNGAKESLAT